MRGRRDWAHKDEGRKGEELEVQEKDRRVKWTICYGQQCPWQIWQWQQQWLNGSGLGSAQPNILQIHRFTIQNRHSKRTLLLVLPSSSRVTTAPLEQVRPFPTLLFLSKVRFSLFFLIPFYLYRCLYPCYLLLQNPSAVRHTFSRGSCGCARLNHPTLFLFTRSR